MRQQLGEVLGQPRRGGLVEPGAGTVDGQLRQHVLAAYGRTTTSGGAQRPPSCAYVINGCASDVIGTCVSRSGRSVLNRTTKSVQVLLIVGGTSCYYAEVTSDDVTHAKINDEDHQNPAHLSVNCISFARRQSVQSENNIGVIH